MRKIRKYVFETNSSSTHSLVLDKKYLNSDIDESVFLEKYDVLSGNETFMGDKDGYHIQSVQDKLTYLVKLILMNFYDIEDNLCIGAKRLLNLLREIFPNTDFSAVNKENYCYYYEDGDWMLHGWDDEIAAEDFLNKDMLKRLFLFGDIYHGNRDDEDFENFIRSLVNNNNYITAECSG